MKRSHFERATFPAACSEPVVLPDGAKLATLRDAGAYITGLPKADHDAKEWQTAMHIQIWVADHGGPIEVVRIGMMQALGRHPPRVYDASRSWRNTRKLVRDR